MILDLARALERDLEGLAREVEMFPDDQSLWETVPGVSNSVGNLARHASGNLKHYIGAVLGGSGYVRQRDAEFAEKGGSREAMARELREARDVVSKTLPTVSEATLAADYPEAVGGVVLPCRLFLVHLCTHLSFHLGQAGYLRRVITEDPRSSGPVSVRELAEG